MTRPPPHGHCEVAEASGVLHPTHELSRDWQHAFDTRTANETLDKLHLRLTHLPAVPIEFRTGPAPHARRHRAEYLDGGRVTADPRYTRRLTDLEAAVLSHILRGCPGPTPATVGVQRALANLRTAGLIQDATALSPAGRQSLER